MQTALTPGVLETAEGQEAEAILRSCVHCGFCTAVCPTYALLGDERDSPRGRIYLIKGVLEGQDVGPETQTHLDRCLTCRACETVCPSGVQYARLAEIGRHALEQHVPRTWRQRVMRRLLRDVLSVTPRFSLLLGLGRLLRPVLSDRLKRKIPVAKPAGAWPAVRHARRVLVPAGCVQPALEPGIDSALARLLDQYGISAIHVATGCCGAIHQHLSAQEQALLQIRVNIDAWWPEIQAGAEAIVETSSACGLMVREYGHLLRHDPAYADKAARVSSMCRDPAELIDTLPLTPVGLGRRIAFHAPCSLQHGLILDGRVESILRKAGFVLLPIAESGMCCGSAGTYSILQPALSGQLLERKLGHLEKYNPELIATANIGCLAHLQSGSHVPVVHWLMLLDHPDIKPED